MCLSMRCCAACWRICATEAGRVPRHRHPCGRGALRSCRSGRRQDRRMAGRHRPADRPRRERLPPRRGAAGALSHAVDCAQSRRSSLPLSRLAGSGAGVAAPTGPADRLRARAAGRRCAGAGTSRRRAQPSVGDRRLDRTVGLYPAEGTPRSRADRSAIRAARRILEDGDSGWRWHTANGRSVSTCSGTRSRTPPRWRVHSANCSRRDIGKMLRIELIVATASEDFGLARQRALSSSIRRGDCRMS